MKLLRSFISSRRLRRVADNGFDHPANICDILKKSMPSIAEPEGTARMVRTLVLNAAYEPIHLVSWQKAMCLVFTAKAEIVAEYDQVARSVSQIFKLPSVVRLKRYVRTFRRTMNARCTRRNILMRDRFTCQYCGLNCTMATVTIDHVMPRSRGGKTVWDNVVAACHPCNRRKADRTPEESNMILKKAPKRPTWVDLLEESHRDLLDSWMPFLVTKVAG